jgi:DNA segregation ATPase FtsK/SpoIIIE-like protein
MMNHDELSGKARELKKKHGSLSIVFLQRKLQIGYQEAKRLMEKVEGKG